MNESGHWDEVESLLSLSDATIHSQSDDDESKDIGNDLEAAQAQENDTVTREDNHEYDEEDEAEEPRPQNQNSTEDNIEHKESKILDAKDSSTSSNKEDKTTIDKNISEKLDVMNNESNLQTRDIDSPSEKSSGKEENQEPEEEMLDGGSEELPFVRSVKYLEKHEIFRLFQNLAAEIVYQRPDNPLQFIVNKLEKEKQESQRKSTKDTIQDSQPR